MSQKFQLFRLQQIDSLLDKAHQRVIEIENILSGNARLKKAGEDLEQSRAVLAKAEKELKNCEQEVQAQQLKINQNQAKLYSGNIKNPKELQDLQNESGALQRHLGTLEDCQLEALMAQEEAEKVLIAAEEEFQTAKNEAAKQNSMLSAELDELEESISRSGHEKDSVLPGLDNNFLEKYEKLRISRRGVAVSRIDDKSCQVCGSSLPQQLIQSSRSEHELVVCPSCGRILYSG